MKITNKLADPKNAGTSVRERSWYLRHTLVHLPSPETIQVLGPYLYDERFTLDPTKDNSGATGPTYRLVTGTLRNIGLRDTNESIRRPGGIGNTQSDLEFFRSWWEEVKSGERTFSFKGQNVEYRFKPDGTWETMPIANPPDDGPQQMEAKPDAPDTREAPSQPDSPADQDEPAPSRWILIPIAVILIGGFFGLRLFRKRQSDPP